MGQIKSNLFSKFVQNLFSKSVQNLFSKFVFKICSKFVQIAQKETVFGLNKFEQGEILC
jgi:hypothetical protein